MKTPFCERPDKPAVEAFDDTIYEELIPRISSRGERRRERFNDVEN